MRTTLSLDDDVAAQLERLRQSSKVSFKELVNNALREGLRQMSAPPAKRKRFEMMTADLGECYLPNLDNIGEVLAAIEGEDYK
jgi:Ribbon-helix-helix protein, copG family